MAREQYIFETNTVNGGFLVDRRTNQTVGTTSNGVDVYFVNATTNPLTGGVELSAGGVAVGDTATFYPPTNDYAGIMIAYNAAVANGGGTVKLAGHFNIGSNTIPLADCVKYQGTGWKAAFQTGKELPLTAFGTVIEGDGTADGFVGNIVPSVVLTGGATYMVSTGVSDMALVNFRRAINTGAENQRGMFASTFQNLAIHNCTDWGMYFENTEQLILYNITLTGNANGYYIGNNAAGFNCGDSPLIKFVYCQDSIGANTTYLSRHVWLNSRNGSLNSVSLEGCGANGPYYNQVFAVAGTANIGVADINCIDTSRFSVGMPVILNPAVAPFVAKKCYFIKSIVPNVSVQLCNFDYTDVYSGINPDPVITPTASGSVTIKTRGFPGIQVSGSLAGAAVTGCHFLNCNTENAGTAQLMFQNAKYCSVKGGEPSSNISKFEVSALYAVLIRDTYDFQLQLAHSGLVDSTNIWSGDSASNDGFPTTAMYVYNYGSGVGTRAYNGRAGALYLDSQEAKPSLRGDPSSAALFFGAPIALVGLNAGTGTTIPAKHNWFSYSSAGAGSFTLSTPVIAFLGLPLLINNPFAGILTINLTSGKVIGMGVEVVFPSTMSIPAYSSAMLVCQYDGTSYYWARYA